jgi:type IV secretion system protein VirB10
MTEQASMNPREEMPSREIRPGIALPREMIPSWLIVALAVVLGIALILYIEANREARQNEGLLAGKEAVKLPSPPPPLIVPPALPPAQAVVIGPAPVPVAAVPLPPAIVRVRDRDQPRIERPAPMLPPQERPRGAEPALVADFTSGSGVAVNGAAGADAAGADDAVRATLIRNRASIIPQGAIIAAVLETPLNSDRPGLARAIVSQDSRGFDGSRVLIPRGSRLIGEFKAETGPGLRRILVTWTRLIRPDGVAIRIGSPVTDAMGGAGVPGSVNTHFAARFASAVLQSALMLGVNAASQWQNNGSSIYVGVPGQMAQVGQDLIPDTKRPPTVKVREGAQIAVLVARDLDFGGTPAVR